jgi:hypothetical protein
MADKKPEKKKSFFSIKRKEAGSRSSCPFNLSTQSAKTKAPQQPQPPPPAAAKPMPKPNSKRILVIPKSPASMTHNARPSSPTPKSVSVTVSLITIILRIYANPYDILDVPAPISAKPTNEQFYSKIDPIQTRHRFFKTLLNEGRLTSEQALYILQFC